MSPSSPKTAPAVEALVDELRHLLVEALMLEDVEPADIDMDAPLFGESGDGLGLDSIDALELAMALHKRYGVKTRSDDQRNREIFQSLRHLAAFVAAERASS
jgi:acyl carrier protein